MAASRQPTALLPQLPALASCAASVLGIVHLAQQSAPVFADVAGGDCIARNRADLDQEKAAGRLTAEQAMMRRQEIRGECS